MKLKTKHRHGSRVRCTYDTAQTPFQRLRPSLDANELKRLQAIFQALDPVRLLRQIETLQDALWKHAVLPTTEKPSEAETPPEVRFTPIACSSHLDEGSPENPALTGPGKRRQRKYHRTKPLQRLRSWRTRPDPFAAVWAEICQWLESNPERTAKSIISDLQQQYPGQFSDGQLRTLQRRVQAWRAQSIISFNDQWLEEDLLATEVLPRPLGVIMEPQHGISNTCNTQSI